MFGFAVMVPMILARTGNNEIALASVQSLQAYLMVLSRLLLGGLKRPLRWSKIQVLGSFRLPAELPRGKALRAVRPTGWCRSYLSWVESHRISFLQMPIWKPPPKALLQEFSAGQGSPVLPVPGCLLKTALPTSFANC